MVDKKTEMSPKMGLRRKVEQGFSVFCVQFLTKFLWCAVTPLSKIVKSAKNWPKS